MIEINKLVKKYDKKGEELTILKELDVTIEDSDWVAIMGESGAGKSTLLNVIGLLDQPTSGSYKLAGTEVATLNETQASIVRRQKIGFVFQSFNLLNQFSVIENVAVPLRLDGMPKDEALSRSSEVLKIVNLADRETHKPTELSGGQQQRVAIARALANQSDLLIADEPTGNLDPQQEAEIIKIFRKLNEEEGKTIVMVTHGPQVAKQAKRIIFLEEGQLSDKDQEDILSVFM